MNRRRTQTFHHRTAGLGAPGSAAYDAVPPTHQSDDRDFPARRWWLAVGVLSAVLALAGVSYAAGFAAGVQWDEQLQALGDPEPPRSAAREAERAAHATVPLGEVGMVEELELEVVVSGVECSTSLPRVRQNPDWDGSPGVPFLLDARAPAGKQLCVVVSSWTNASAEPVFLTPSETFRAVVTDEELRFAATGDDVAWSRTLTERRGQREWTLNPGDVAQLHTVLTVPSGSVVTHAVVEPPDPGLPETWFATR